MQVEFVDDLANPSDGPQFLDEPVRLVGAAVNEVGSERELLLLASIVAGERHFGRATLAVAADDDELLTVEQIGELLRVHPSNRFRFGRRLLTVKFDRHADVGQQR